MTMPNTEYEESEYLPAMYNSNFMVHHGAKLKLSSTAEDWGYELTQYDYDIIVIKLTFTRVTVQLLCAFTLTIPSTTTKVVPSTLVSEIIVTIS